MVDGSISCCTVGDARESLKVFRLFFVRLALLAAISFASALEERRRSQRYGGDYLGKR